MAYKMENKELQIASCSIADLTPGQIQLFTEQWGEGSNISTLTLFYEPSSGLLVLNRDNTYYEAYKDISEGYLSSNDEQRRELREKAPKSMRETLQVLEACVCGRSAERKKSKGKHHGQVNLINLKEIIKYHPYHISTFAQFADVTLDLLEGALKGEEELTDTELFQIARYCKIPYGVLKCPKLIWLHKENYKHRKMIEDLVDKRDIILEAQKAGNKDAEHFMGCGHTDLVIMELDFIINGFVSYGKYLGIKERVEQTLSFIANAQRKPRQRKEQR